MEKIGRYLAKQEIGQGGMATVYLGEDPKIKRDVAIKLFNYEAFKGDKTTLELFYKEAESAGKLSHPNIVTIYDIGEDKGIPYIVMEYLEGKSLASLLEHSFHFSFEDALDITIQLCSALEYAHKKRVIHRDIKPGNIILLSDGTIRLTDFGIAKVIGSSSKKDLGSKVGTPGYMSLEQIDDKPVDYRTDIFSSGIIFYELLTAKRAFKGKTLEEMRRKIIKMDLIPPSQKDRTIPVETDEVVFRAIASNPEERYQKISEFKDHLQTMRKKSGRKKESIKAKVPTYPVGPISFAEEVKTTPISKKRLYLPLMIAAGIIIISVIILYFSIFKKGESGNLEKDSSQSLQSSSATSESFNLNSILNEANDHLKSGEYEKAEELYNKILENDDKNPKAYYGKGEMLFNKELCYPAIDNFNKALEFDPTMAKAHLMIAKCSYKKFQEIEDMKYIEEALEACEKAIEVNPWLKEAEDFRKELKGKVEEMDEIAKTASKAPSPKKQKPEMIKKEYGSLSINTIPGATTFSLWKEGSGEFVLRDVEVPFEKKDIEAGKYIIEFTIIATGEKTRKRIAISKNVPFRRKWTFEANVALSCNPYARIIIDDKIIFEPPGKIPLSVGWHTFVAEREGRKKSKRYLVHLQKPNHVYFAW